MGEYCRVGADGRRIHYVTWGAPDRPVVILLHAQSGFVGDWRDIGPALGRDFRVLALDHPGFGDSDRDPTGVAYTVAGLAGDVERFREALGLDRFGLIGHSVGGRVALEYATSHPRRVPAVVLVDSAPAVDPRGSVRARTYLATLPVRFASMDDAVRFFSAIYPRYSQAELRQRLEHYLRRGADGHLWTKRDPVIGDTYRRMIDGARDAPPPDWTPLRQVRCPILLLRGMESDLITPPIADRMKQEQPRLEVVEIVGAGHLIPTERPEEAAAKIREFLLAESVAW